MRKVLFKHVLRKNIGIVQQDVFLYTWTIKENIKYGNQNATDEEVIEAAKKANIHEFITELKDGYDTYIGERGVKLSGGQKQRISIARNLGQARDVNIFDDTLSALDSRTEKKIMNRLINQNSDNTLIVISNKISSVKQLDKIYILLDGEIQESGTHEELLEKNEFYRELNYLERKEETDEIFSKEKC